MEIAARRDWRSTWDLGFRTLIACCGLAALALMVWITGWKHEARLLPWLEVAARSILASYAIGVWGRLLISTSRWAWLRQRWFPLLLGVLTAALSLEFQTTLMWLQERFPHVAVAELTFLLVGVMQAPVVVDVGLRFLRFHEVFAERKVSPGAVMMVTFGALIALGTLLLKMPRATVHGISWLDALFTSTSAVCVTGLSVVDTEMNFTPTGRAILLLLIQVGGLGVMTLSTFLAAIFGSLSLRGRVLLQDLLSEDNLGRIGRTLPLLLFMTLAFETIGAVALHAAMSGVDDPRGTDWFSAVFHSVSAFCNAGFSIWSGGLYDPVVRGNMSVQAIVMLLVVAGGLGYPALYATGEWLGGRMARLGRRRRRRAVLTLHARLAWSMTVFLIVGGALCLWAAERGHVDANNGSPAWFSALFNSITARTAGFNVGPIEALSPASVMVLVFLMFIGGSPGSTAGGVKTTVFAVAMLNARRILLGRRDVEIRGRRLSEDLVARALAVIIIAVVWIVIAAIILALVQPALPLGDVVFEVVSAVSTVGLTRGVTPQLEVAGKVLIVLTMFVGRIGVLYFVLAFIRRREASLYRLPEESVIVA